MYYNPETYKNIWYNYKFREYSNQSKENICSEFGKQLRMNRSIQVEGSLGLIKETLKFRKLKVRGKENVEREIGFLLLGYNFKMHILKKKNKKIGNILHELKKRSLKMIWIKFLNFLVYKNILNKKSPKNLRDFLIEA